MRGFVWLASLFSSILLCAALSVAAMAYTSTWTGTIGSSSVQACLREYDYHYYYTGKNQWIRLNKNSQYPNIWKESIRAQDWEGESVTGVWQLDSVSDKYIQGVRIDMKTKEKTAIDLKRISFSSTSYDCDAAFYAPIINSLQYSYGKGKFEGISYKTIETDGGSAFEIPGSTKNADKVNTYMQSWLKQQAIEYHNCQKGGGIYHTWHRKLEPIFWSNEWLVISDIKSDPFCFGSKKEYYTFNLNTGERVDVWSWLKNSNSSTDIEYKFRELLDKRFADKNPDSDKPHYFAGPVPTGEGLMFYNDSTVSESFVVSYKDLSPYLTESGKKAVFSITHGMSFFDEILNQINKK